MQASAIDLRFRVKELLDAVRRGEEVVITYRGKPCARLVPLGRTRHDQAEDREDSPPLFGIWGDNQATSDVDEYIDGLRRGRS